MAKKKGSLVYKCNSCGNTQPRWLGRCPECEEWNSFEECLISENGKKSQANSNDWLVQKPVKLSSVDAKLRKHHRLDIGTREAFQVFLVAI